MTRQALFLVNTHSRRGRHSREEAMTYLEHHGFELFAVSPSNYQELPQVIRKYGPQMDLVIIGGGDGTLNGAVDALVEIQRPLGILPMGTANDLARTLQIPLSIPAACRAIATGKLHQIDLGWVNGKYFFNVASLGLSVKITGGLSKQSKGRWGILAYAMSALKVLTQSRLFDAEIRAGEESHKVKTIQIAIGNGRYYGGGMAIAHDAAIDDQRLDLYSLGLEHWWQILAIFPALRQGRYHTLPGILSLNGTEMQVYTRHPLPINTDGEITTTTPAHFRVIPKALSIFIPGPKPQLTHQV
ncbi:lipid kinase [Roseofilum reptotaenium CS-1145]|uniref:Lipid kinase n=1 Tax=Roseofilum reptotaenium AO1-A TaxID=1925591 RepID=A0A1L9QSQ5_9CYAN|nr:lipid kinase [Roseofilum reptotaenium]MDB9518845.1 lipid kinase [Roseofilum reptotaenium CS-1145]OJJ25720.1 lipid kinase [Roseofilum reptotaenium AO1-A]